MTATIILFTVAVLAFAILLLLSKAGKQTSDWLLLAWFCLFAVHLAALYFLESLPPVFLRLNTVAAFLHGPLFYVYLCRLAAASTRGLPAPWHLGLMLIVGAITSFLAQPVPFVVNAVLLCAYLTLSRKTLTEAPPERFTPAIRQWVYLLMGGLLILLLIPALQLVIDVDAFDRTHNVIGTLAYCAFICLLTFWGVRAAPVLLAPPPSPAPAAAPPTERYEQSGTTPERRRSIYKEITSAMENEQLFLDPTLQLRSTAERLGVNANQLSEAVNDGSSQNFNDFLNAYRVAAVRERFDAGDHDQLTFLAIAYECGFNSKASFNRAFRKHTGMTPSAYVKRHKQA